MDIIRVVSLDGGFTQIPNWLISEKAITNDTFRVLCWLISLRDGSSVSSRQLSTAAGVGYDGRPHRRLMKDLRDMGVMRSFPSLVGGKVAGEYLVIDLRILQKTPVRADRPNRRAKRPKNSCVSSEPLKTNTGGIAAAPSGSGGGDAAVTLIENERCSPDAATQILNDYLSSRSQQA